MIGGQIRPWVHMARFLVFIFIFIFTGKTYVIYYCLCIISNLCAVVPVTLHEKDFGPGIGTQQKKKKHLAWFGPFLFFFKFSNVCLGLNKIRF